MKALFVSRMMVIIIAAAGISGCYTQVASYDEETGDRGTDAGEYYASDSSTQSGTTVINNYFGDDSYRFSRYRLSFSYYRYNNGWYDPWYEPWYNDYYSYRPFYGCYSYHPYWYYQGWYGVPLYATGSYYYNDGYAYAGSTSPGRRRTSGTSRGNENSGRTGTVPAASPLPAETRAAAAVDHDKEIRSGERRRLSGTESVSPSVRPSSETPWWKRLRNNENDARRAEAVRTKAPNRKDSEPAVNPGTATRKKGEADPEVKSAEPRQQPRRAAAEGVRRERPPSSEPPAPRRSEQPRVAPRGTSSSPPASQPPPSSSGGSTKRNGAR